MSGFPSGNAAGATLTLATPPGSTPALVRSDTGDGGGYRQRFQIENNPAQANVDIDFRNATVNFGNPDSSVSGVGTQILSYAPLGDTSQRFTWFALGSSTVALGHIGPNGDLLLAVGGRSSNAITVKVAEDAQFKWRCDENGVLTWGPGGAVAADTNIYRGAANQLKTDDDLAVVGKAGFNNTTPRVPSITGALSTVTDAAAKAVLTSIIAALTSAAGVGLATSATT